MMKSRDTAASLSRLASPSESLKLEKSKNGHSMDVLERRLWGINMPKKVGVDFA